MAGERYGRGMGTVCYVWIGLNTIKYEIYVTSTWKFSSYLAETNLISLHTPIRIHSFTSQLLLIPILSRNINLQCIAQRRVISKLHRVTHTEVPFGQKNFSSPNTSRSAPRPTQSSLSRVLGCFPGGKAAGVWCCPLPSIQFRGSGWVELYLYSPSVTSWLVWDSFTLIHVYTDSSRILWLKLQSKWYSRKTRTNFLYKITEIPRLGEGRSFLY